MYIWIGYAVGLTGMFSIVLFVNKFPLINDELALVDRTLGFDWYSYAHILLDNPILNAFFSFAYATMTFQGLLLTIMIAMLRNNQCRIVEACYFMVACGITGTIIARFHFDLGQHC